MSSSVENCAILMSVPGLFRQNQAFRAEFDMTLHIGIYVQQASCPLPARNLTPSSVLLLEFLLSKCRV